MLVSSAYTAADVQALVAEVLDSGIDHDSLIHHAAAGLAAVCARELRARVGAIYGRRVALLVGSGNNGADVMFAGARLAKRGVRVHVILVKDHSYPPALQAVRAAGGRVRHARSDDLDEVAGLLARADMVIDGIVGDRGRGGLSGVAEELALILNALPVLVVAADLPSGIDPDTGEISGTHIEADVTVTFGVAKPCLLLPPAAHSAGRLVLVAVGLPPMNPELRAVERWGAPEIATAWPVPQWFSHKYTRGVLGVVAGSDTYPGAAVLACVGAVRAGVGMARYVGPPSATEHVLRAAPVVVPGEPGGRVQAWLLGSGVARGSDQDAAISAALDTGLPCVVDAGALSACATRRAAGDRPTDASQLLMTPHAGEVAALLADLGHDVTRDQVEQRPLQHARWLATAVDATVLLKGSITLLVRPDGPVGSVAGGPPWLATAGAGDVLAGIAGALMAAGRSAYEAGTLAAYIHGNAALRASNGGPISATDVADAVPAAVAALLQRP